MGELIQKNDIDIEGWILSQLLTYSPKFQSKVQVFVNQNCPRSSWLHDITYTL